MTSTRRIPLRARDGSVRAWALVDAEDFEALSAHVWHQSNMGYVLRNVPSRERRGVQAMHRQIMGLEYGDPREVDHRNRDRLDNRKSNLRLTDRKGNGQNLSPRTDGASRHRGVCFHKPSGKWRAYVNRDRRQHHLGLFEVEDDAATAARRGRELFLPMSEV